MLLNCAIKKKKKKKNPANVQLHQCSGNAVYVLSLNMF